MKPMLKQVNLGCEMLPLLEKRDAYRLYLTEMQLVN